MSLLIDALRKAEQMRREGEFRSERPDPAEPEDAAELRLEPRPPPVSPPATPELPDEATAEATGTQRANAPEAAAATATATGTRAAARRIFEVKQAPRPRLFWPMVGGLTAVAVAALGGYLWWELQPRGLMTAEAPAAAPPPRPRPALALALAPAPAAAPDLTAAPPGAPAPAQEPPPQPRRAPAREAPLSRGSFTPPPAETPAESALGIRRGGPADYPLTGDLSSAYSAYNAGDLALAANLYGKILKQDPHNRDALDGMGAIALRQGRDAEAEAWFRRSLAADPNDATAQAGLAELRNRVEPGEGETRMRSLVAAQPDAAPGHFALGNALAAQNRWAEAQQAYFEAHARDPGNPDYLFNLAVSLDRLHQYPLARRFYGEALTAATNRSASFERGPVEARLQVLNEAQ